LAAKLERLVCSRADVAHDQRRGWTFRSARTSNASIAGVA